MPINFDLYDYAKKLKVYNLPQGLCYLDPTRKKYLRITPEESVRQSLILKLNVEHKISLGLMRTELEISINNLKKRLDLAIFNNDGRVLMIIETKAPDVKFTQKVADQVALYNNVTFAPWLMLSNGIEAAIYHIDFQNKITKEVFTFPEINET